MICGIDRIGLLDRAMIEPQDDISIIAIILKVRSSYGDWLVGVVGEDCEGACSIEANSTNSFWVNVLLA